MAVRSFVKALDNEHLLACAIGGRNDVGPNALWRVEEFVRPLGGADAFNASVSFGDRASMDSLGRMLAASLYFLSQAPPLGPGAIAGGTAAVLPIGFELSGPNAKFDAAYGLRFPSHEEVVEERATRGI